MTRNDDFDRTFNRITKIGVGIWIVWALIVLAAIVAVVFVGGHFIAKHW